MKLKPILFVFSLLLATIHAQTNAPGTVAPVQVPPGNTVAAPPALTPGADANRRVIPRRGTRLPVPATSSQSLPAPTLPVPEAGANVDAAPATDTTLPAPTLPVPSTGANTDLAAPDAADPTADGTDPAVAPQQQVTEPVEAPAVVAPPVVVETPVLPVPAPVTPTNAAPFRSRITPSFPRLPTPGGTNRVTLPFPPGNPAAPNQNAFSQISTNAAGEASRLEIDQNDMVRERQLQILNMPLDQFLNDFYAPLARRSIIRATQIAGASPNVTFINQTDLTREEAVAALEGVLAANNVALLKIGDKFVKAVGTAQAEKEGAPLTEKPSGDIALNEEFVTKIVQLSVAKPSEIQPTLATFSKSPGAVTAIDSNNTLILRDYASNVKRMMDIIQRVDVQPQTDMRLEVIPIKYGKVEDIYATMSALISDTGAAGGVGGIRNPTFPATGNNAFRSGVGNNNFNRGGFNQQNRNTGFGGGNYYPQQAAAPVTANQNSFQSRLNNVINRAAGVPPEAKVLENAKIVPDTRSNTLLIFANNRDMSMITNLVQKVDVLLAQVLLEAVILEVKLGDKYRLGVSAVQNPKKFGQDFTGAGVINNGQPFLNNLTNFPGAAPDGFTYFGKINDTFDVTVNALAEDSNINIVSRPRIQTSHAIPGFFFIGETVPYITGFTDYGGLTGSGLSTRSSITERTIGLNLAVTPFITPDGLVVMEISQQFDQRGQDVIIENNPVPLVNSRQAEATLTVRDGDMIMLGGFISENKSKNKSGVPFLKDIPGIGALFRSKNTSNDRTELIILMKATVLQTPEDAALIARSERAQLPGVAAAEQEFDRSQEKYKKQLKSGNRK
ncbi:MAG: secretin N-terminal domain-containing protein [Verrucomicrobiota bacterium]|nr:secretin N-terminal domain-containing protein [Verrucomicrobiota bacterium]